jgi:hypothetical protein
MCDESDMSQTIISSTFRYKNFNHQRVLLIFNSKLSKYKKLNLGSKSVFCPACILLLLFLFCANITATAQVDYVIIDSVRVQGAKKTHNHVIFQEITFRQGDTINLSQLSDVMNSNEKRLQSMGLFTYAKINLKNWNADLGSCYIEITLQENWFFYPYIIFELADRNFNVWRKEQNYDIKRVNYGLALDHINFTGHKDKLKLKFQTGYTKKYETSYEYPYLGHHWGLSINYLYSANHETAYKTSENKPVFFKSSDQQSVLKKQRLSLGFLHRNNALLQQSVHLEYNFSQVSEKISQEINPEYFGFGRSTINFLALEYSFRYNNTILPFYPLGGSSMELNIRKDGLGLLSDINNTWVSADFKKYFSWKQRLVWSSRVKGKVHIQNNALPYFLNTALGYKKDNITGYQLYVVDGRNFFIMNNAVKYLAWNKDIKFGKFIPSHFRMLNIKAFLRFNFDYGYVHDPVFGQNNFLTNKFNYGYGPSIDIVAFNNILMSCQYGITKFGERGWFYHIGTSFN